MNPLIEKKLAEFDEKFVVEEYEHYEGPHWYELSGEPKDVKLFLTTALQEALLAGIELAEGVVPAPKLVSTGEISPNDYESGLGFNTARLETLSRLASLKESISSTSV